MRKSASGFTIVELLIVIVVIAILATISIVAFNGVQKRANDTARISDMTTLTKALAIYATQQGNFPASAPNPGSSTWEISTDPGFMSSLNAITNSKVFKAPGSSVYWYHTFAAGSYNCPASLGPYYVLWVTGMQAQTGGAKITTNGCTNQSLSQPAENADPTNWVYFGFLPG